MAKDPDMRYQTMENLCSDLIAVLQGDEPFYCYNAPVVDGSGNIYLQHTRSTVVAPALNPNLIPPSRTVSTAAQAPGFKPLQKPLKVQILRQIRASLRHLLRRARLWYAVL
jgi:hypothetical protein